MQVPSSLFESLQASLQQEARRICRDAAKILRVPEKELEQKVLKSMGKITIVKDQSPTSCHVLMDTEKLLQRCRLPCILGTGRCHKHQEIISVPEGGFLTRIEAQEELEPLWCDESSGVLYNKNAEEVGNYKNSRLTVFILEP